MSSGIIIVGDIVSITETCCVAVAMFPASSLAVHVIVVNPNGKTSGASLLTDVTPTKSSALIELYSTTFWSLLIASTVIIAGTRIVGGVVSTTVIV